MKFGFFRLFRFSLGTLVLLGVAVGGLGGLNLYTYQRFTEEAPVATLTFSETGPRSFQVTLLPTEGAAQSFVLAGDEWQLDARMIKWTDWLTFLGESPLYRLDRISGRYISIDEARANAQTMHRLSEEQGIDVWAFARRAGEWLPGIDAAYGSSVFLPMADGLVYEVSMSRTGLLARPAHQRRAGGGGVN